MWSQFTRVSLNCLLLFYFLFLGANFHLPMFTHLTHKKNVQIILKTCFLTPQPIFQCFALFSILRFHTGLLPTARLEVCNAIGERCLPERHLHFEFHLSRMFNLKLRLVVNVPAVVPSAKQESRDYIGDDKWASCPQKFRAFRYEIDKSAPYKIATAGVGQAPYSPSSYSDFTH